MHMLIHHKKKKQLNLQDFHPVTNYTPLSVDFTDLKDFQTFSQNKCQLSLDHL